MASISTTMVCKVTKLTEALPSTFFKHDFVNPISLSQKPPNHGALFGMNRHSTCCLLSVSFSTIDSNNFFNSSAADVYVEALSDIINLGSDFRAANLRKARMNVGTDKSVTISRCIALVVAHVKRQIYALFSVPDPFKYNAPVKSTPVISNGRVCWSLAFGSGGGSGGLYAVSVYFSTGNTFTDDLLH